ncbi:MAG: PAS domain S-box protein [Deltaproteobacteria bacterium]|nr:PAS domain S-box protein [Deltaproteobacteria bacterium]
MGKEKRTRDEILSELQVLNSILSTLIEEKNRKNQSGKIAGAERDFIDVVLDAAGTMTVVYNQEGRIVCFNRACCEATGFSPREVIGKFVWELSPTQEEAERVRQEFNKLKIGKRVNRLETYWAEKRGGKRLITWENTVLSEGKGKEGYIIGLGIDITDLQRAEDNLRKSEEKYRALIETANDAIILADAETGVILDVNAKAGELLGLPVEDIIGQCQHRLHPEEEVLKYRGIFKDAVKSGGGNYNNLAVTRRDGSRVPVDISASVTEIGGRKVMQGIFRDIRERKRAETTIKEREERLNAFFTNAPAGLVIVDANLRFCKINKTLAKIHGITVEEHAGKTIEEVLPELSSEIVPVCRQVLGEGKPILNQEISGVTPATPGVVRHFVCSAFPIPGPDGQPAEVGWIIVENTVQKIAEESLT